MLCQRYGRWSRHGYNEWTTAIKVKTDTVTFMMTAILTLYSMLTIKDN